MSLLTKMAKKNFDTIFDPRVTFLAKKRGL